MARKKIVFIIVEGPSDEVALGAVLSKVFDSSSVYVHIMFGDITTQSMAGNKTIVSSIGMVSCLWQLINKPEASAGCFRFFYSMPKAYRKKTPPECTVCTFRRRRYFMLGEENQILYYDEKSIIFLCRASRSPWIHTV